MKEHQKHTKLSKANVGFFGRNEISILGSTCPEIKKIAGAISKRLSNQYHVSYVDADHKSGDEQNNLAQNFVTVGNQLQYTDKIDFDRFDVQKSPNAYTIKKQFADQDLILINGNHFEANQQIVIIDPRKSLEAKLSKITNVIAILILDGSVPDFLASHLAKYDIPQYPISDIDAIVGLIDNLLKANIPIVQGLVLTGGKSERMLRDKSSISYHGKPQKEHMFDLLTLLTSKAYYSIRSDQNNDTSDSINDTFDGLGPYGGILSAFRQDPNCAWLVVACDQPFLDQTTLSILLSRRKPSKIATAFYNPETDFPEPLVTIWEPKAYPHLLYYLSLGYSCPRKVLINSDIELVKLNDSTVLRNANTPDEHAAAVRDLMHG